MEIVNSNSQGVCPPVSTKGETLGTNYYAQDGQQIVTWESRIGLKTSTNGAQSPATRLEHEIDHAVDEADHPSEHRGRRDTPNGQFVNEEEKRVILGSEFKTATANGETTRNNHYGTPYKVSSPISIF